MGSSPMAKRWALSNPPAIPVDVSDHGIRWSSGFAYDGQLLRLAVDLAQRLLPAFYTVYPMHWRRQLPVLMARNR
jgi:hypothetical protein